MQRQVTLSNGSGLHARPAAVLVAEANKFQSEVYVECHDKRVTAKSILGLLSLGLSQGESLTIVTEGPDEAEALNAVCQLIESGLGE